MKVKEKEETKKEKEERKKEDKMKVNEDSAAASTNVLHKNL